MKLNNNNLQISGDFPDGWTVTTLGKVLPLTYGKALKKDIRDKSGSVPVFGSSGQVGSHSSALTKKAALIIGRKGSVGEVYRSAVPCWPIDTAYFSEEREDIDLNFFEYLLKGLKLNRLDRSTAIPGLSRDDYNAVEVAIAPLNQQKKIVAEIEKQFSRLDEAVANLNRVKANLKRYKAAVLKDAVEGRLVETEAEIARREGRSYETGAELLKRMLESRRKNWRGKGKYKEPVTFETSEPSGLPEGWSVASLESITSATRVICYGILMPKENVDDGVLYVKVRDMKGDVIDIQSLNRTSASIAEKYQRASLKSGDLLLSIRGTYGRVAVVPPVLEGGNITQDTARLDVSRILDSSYVAAFLRSDNAQRYFKGVARGVAVKGVNIGDLRPMMVPIPPIAEQRRIALEVDRRLTIRDEVAAAVDVSLKRERSLRNAVLQSTFAGGG